MKKIGYIVKRSSFLRTASVRIDSTDLRSVANVVLPTYEEAQQLQQQQQQRQPTAPEQQQQPQQQQQQLYPHV